MTPAATPSVHESAFPPPMRQALAFLESVGGFVLVERMSRLFTSSATARVSDMRIALEAGDRERLRRLAHAMKGSAAQVGAEGVRELSGTLERIAIDAPVADLLPHVDAVEWALTPAFSSLHGVAREMDPGRAA